MIKLILQIYFSINIFIAGYNYNGDSNWAKTTKDKVIAYFLIIFNVLFGLVFNIFIFLAEMFKLLYKKLDGFFQMTFFFKFYILGKYRNEPIERLNSFNEFAESKRKVNSIKNKIYLKGVDLINKRNNFEFKNKQQ